MLSSNSAETLQKLSTHQQCAELIAQSTQHLTESLQENIVFFYQASSISSPVRWKNSVISCTSREPRGFPTTGNVCGLCSTFKFVIKVKTKLPKKVPLKLKDWWRIVFNAASSLRDTNLGHNMVLGYSGVVTWTLSMTPDNNVYTYIFKKAAQSSFGCSLGIGW